MKNHKELHSLVVKTLEIYEHKGINPTAKEVYREIKEVKPTITRKYEFKSFVKIINFFPDVKAVNMTPQRYMTKV